MKFLNRHDIEITGPKTLTYSHQPQKNSRFKVNIRLSLSAKSTQNQ